MTHFKSNKAKKTYTLGPHIPIYLIYWSPPREGFNFLSWKVKNNPLPFTGDDYWPLHVYESQTFVN